MFVMISGERTHQQAATFLSWHRETGGRAKCWREKSGENLVLRDLGPIYAGALHNSANMFKPV